jgi:hypothetical protein
MILAIVYGMFDRTNKTTKGFIMKTITSVVDNVTRTYGGNKVILQRKVNDNNIVVTSHSDNAYDLYEREYGKKTGRICFTVTKTIKTLDKKQTFLPDTPYRLKIGRVPFAKLLGYTGMGHSIGFLNNKGIRTLSGNLIGK